MFDLPGCLYLRCGFQVILLTCFGLNVGFDFDSWSSGRAPPV